MLIERTLEEKIITAIAAAIPATAAPHIIAGFWQPSAAGKIKGINDDPSAVALLEIATGLANQQTFSDPNVTFSVTVQITARLDLDPTGNALLTFTEPLSNLFRSWMAATYQQSFTTLDITGLSIDEVSVSGGSPAIDSAAMIGRIRFDITLSGSYQPTT